ncbi:MAG TPA: hypothetical protein VFV05_25515 [Methylomirabilota bacterium]|nr:hypothetical protein [Methylomirabilota bacterium]
MYAARAALATVQHRWTEAERDFETAVEIDRRYGLPWDEARTLYKWALMTRAWGGASARDRAREQLGAALTLFERTGARRDAEKVRAALAC